MFECSAMINIALSVVATKSTVLNIVSGLLLVWCHVNYGVKDWRYLILNFLRVHNCWMYMWIMSQVSLKLFTPTANGMLLKEH